MRTRMFLRTSEFLWQEGHTAHATAKEAEEETLRMLEVYRNLIEDKMCIPLITGKKSPSERFPGAIDTYTVEAMMQDGKSLQAGTSHYLGQGFAKSANIKFQDQNGDWQFAHTTSWGVSTRIIGGLIMVHSDDDGLRLPPQIAPQQVIILPILKNNETDESVLNACNDLKDNLQKQTFAQEKVRVRIHDNKRKSSGVKWDYVRKGVPLLVEIGSKDIKNGTIALLRRDDVHGKKSLLELNDFIDSAADLLTSYEQSLINDAKLYNKEKTVDNIHDFKAFKKHFAQNSTGFVKAKWCEDMETEQLLDDMGITIRCLPLEQTDTEGICVLTGKPAKTDAIFAKAY